MTCESSVHICQSSEPRVAKIYYWGRRLLAADSGAHSDVRYDGACSCWHLYASWQSLYMIRWSTGSQWSLLRVIVEIETRSNVRNFRTCRAAAFKTDCNERMFAVATSYITISQCVPTLQRSANSLNSVLHLYKFNYGRGVECRLSDVYICFGLALQVWESDGWLSLVNV